MNINIPRFVRAVVVLCVVFAGGVAHAGWNYGSRKNCKIFAKYRVEAHAGWRTVPLGGGGGQIAGPVRDTGCTYAHAGPVRSYTGAVLLAEAEGYIGNSAFWGYARTCEFYDPATGLTKRGIAGIAQDTASGARVAAAPQCQIQQSASNHLFLADVIFGQGAAAGQNGITIRGVTANFAASSGYSVLEIVVWRLADDLTRKIPDDTMTPAKTVWRSRAIVHAGKLTIEGELSPRIFTTGGRNTMDQQVVYSIENQDVVIPLPANVNTDDLMLNIKGDAGDDSILKPQEPPVTISNLNMQGGDANTPCPPIGVSLRREDAGAKVPYLAAVLTGLQKQCIARDPALNFDSVTFVSCTKDPRPGLGPNATADLTCRK